MSAIAITFLLLLFEASIKATVLKNFAIFICIYVIYTLPIIFLLTFGLSLMQYAYLIKFYLSGHSDAGVY